MSIIGQERSEDDSGFSFLTDNGEKARLLGLRKRGGDWRRSDRPNMFYPFYVDPKTKKAVLEQNSQYSEEVLPIRPNGEESRWTWGKETSKLRLNKLVAKEIVRNNLVVFDIYRIDLVEETDGVRKREKLKSVWNDKELNYQHARQYFKELFGNSEIFDFPKAPELVTKLLKSLDTKNCIVLDFFSGSCSTAHAVLRMNVDDVGARKFIMVQLPEPCHENSEAYKAGYKTIAEIGKERIRRVIKKIKAEEETLDRGNLFKSKETKDNKQPDLGFKVFKLDSSNIKPWEAGFDNLDESLFDAVENIKSERSEADVLYELLLKYGLDLTVPIEKRNIDDKVVYIIEAGALIVCLADEVSLDVVEGIARLKDELKPELMRVVFKDAGFEDDVVKTNTVQILRQHGIEDVKSI